MYIRFVQTEQKFDRMRKWCLIIKHVNRFCFYACLAGVYNPLHFKDFLAVSCFLFQSSVQFFEFNHAKTFSHSDVCFVWSSLCLCDWNAWMHWAVQWLKLLHRMWTFYCRNILNLKCLQFYYNIWTHMVI